MSTSPPVTYGVPNFVTCNAHPVPFMGDWLCIMQSNARCLQKERSMSESHIPDPTFMHGHATTLPQRHTHAK
jgi:hypothetical protein